MSKFKFVSILTIVSALFYSCANDNMEKKPWTEEQKQEFKDNCFFSTRFSYEQLGVKLEKEQIEKICDCTALELESEYAYTAAKRIPKAKMETILKSALEKCAPEVSHPHTADSLSTQK